MPVLRKYEGLYLVPDGHLTLLPLHACKTRDNERDVYLCDTIHIAYLPHAAYLTTIDHAPRWDGNIFSISNPGRGRDDTLVFAEWEHQILRVMSLLQNRI